MTRHTSDPDCAFCAIAGGRDPAARIVYVDDDVVAFFPTEPATLGHTLVVPRLHASFVWDLPENVASVLGAAVARLAGVVKEAIKPEGLNVIQSNGAAATQTVPHVHVHLLPRWREDEVGPIWPPETDYSEEQKDKAWTAIRDGSRLLRG